MSEFWVSKKRYWCKYCETYIADDAPSRSQHENGLRHKGNKERFVNKLYKHAEQKKKDAVEEQREMARVDQAARAAFASDVSSGHAKASSSAPPPPRAPAAATASSSKPKPSSPWANYSTAQSLGYADPDEERRAAEAERQRTQGVAGAWQIVETPPPPVEAAVDQTGTDLPGEHPKNLKREAAAVAVDEDDTRSFKVRKKTWGGMGDLWDPADVPIKLKPKKVESTVTESSEASTATLDPTTTSSSHQSEATSDRPKWTTKGWNTPAGSATVQDQGSASSSVLEDDSSTSLKVEVDRPSVKIEDIREDLAIADDVAPAIKTEQDVKTEAVDPVPSTNTSGMFRKRKAPAGSAGSRAKR